jgi:CHAP domain
MTSPNDVLKLARAELGTTENPVGSNHVKYCDWYYGVPGSRAAWCGIFVSWVMYHAGLPLPFTISKGFAAVRAGVAGFQTRGQWHTSNPRVGDVAFFTYSHVGIVESVQRDGSIVTIEGNSSHRVQRLRHPQSTIRGYGRPKYSEEDSTDNWFWGLSAADLKSAVREVLNEGTAKGQKAWAGTSEATLGTAQGMINLLKGDLIADKLSVSTGELKTLLEQRSTWLNSSNR